MGNFNKTFNARNPLKYGKTSGEAATYSSATQSPLGYSPLKQVEEVPVEETPVEEPTVDGGEEEQGPWIMGQETGEVYKDEKGLYVIMGEGDDMYRGSDPNYDQKLYIPSKFVNSLGAGEGGFIDDRDIGYEKIGGEWTITEIDIHEEEKEER